MSSAARAALEVAQARRVRALDRLSEAGAAEGPCTAGWPGCPEDSAVEEAIEAAEREASAERRRIRELEDQRDQRPLSRLTWLVAPVALLAASLVVLNSPLLVVWQSAWLRWALVGLAIAEIYAWRCNSPWGLVAGAAKWALRVVALLASVGVLAVMALGALASLGLVRPG